MTRKLGRLLVVALVVAAVVAPMSVASADVIDIPTLYCAGIEYDSANPYHVVYPVGIDFDIALFTDQWALWNSRHHGDLAPTDPIPYLNFDMNAVSDVLGAPPAGESYVFFWNDMVFDDPGEPLPSVLRVRVVGTPYDDVICGSNGMDVILGGDGDDYLVGGAFSPAAGGADDDILLGQKGDDVLIGGRGSDGLSGGGGNDELFGLWPDESFYPDAPPFEFPHPYYDPTFPTTYNDMYGGAGNDTFYASCGPSVGDDAHGNGGDDTFYGCDGIDYFWGMAGNDTILGGEGQDWLIGGPGNDEIWGGRHWDKIRGDGGSDLLYGNEPDFCGLSVAEGEYSSGDVIWGGADDDYICGDAGAGRMYGNGGDDEIDAGYGNDQKVYGGAGDDTINGGPGNDWLYGSNGNDTIDGGEGSDDLRGYAGDDILYGGVTENPADFDRLMGGPGSDSLYAQGPTTQLFGNFAIVGASPDGAADYMYSGPATSITEFFGDCDDGDWAFGAIGAFVDLYYIPNYTVTGAIVTVSQACPT